MNSYLIIIYEHRLIASVNGLENQSCTRYISTDCKPKYYRKLKKRRNLQILIMSGIIGKQDGPHIIRIKQRWMKLMRENNDECNNENKNKILWYTQIVTIILKKKMENKS